MSETNWDKNRDKLEKDENIFGVIKKYKDDEGLSWSKLAKEIYNKLTEANDEYLTAEEEKQIIKNFSENLKRAVSRKQESTKMGEKKVFLQDICAHLKLEYKKNLPRPKELKYKEHYIDLNTNILYEERPLWDKFIEKALLEVEDAAQNGFKEAQTTLGHFYYYHGKNGMRNVLKALELYQLAAEQDDEIALFQLGRIYEYGDDVKQDDVRAYKYYEKAARKEFPLAFSKLAFCYYQGIGVEKSTHKFFEYAKKATEHNDVIGSLYLAFAYKEGVSIEPNKERAIEIYETLLDNEKAERYLIEILWALAILYKEEHSSDKAKEYFDRSIDEWSQMMKVAWKTEQFDSISQFFSSTPERSNEILKCSHYDYIYTPSKPTILKALVNS
ncbi:sel1 repeat family protein [Actinobacillus equuli subsp. equuli]|uniref:Sel1 repeat family protein n=1 Tax=Actinobacillus equuli subsp. equuli TaxID=202947 RepID=A0A9X4G5E6_ACTEU|nr:tetratricopeptide repeat protein [Actinobacillus equuli]MDE8034540.1 sel1 repeat family protein [Actinobacillus equuli subsp. equuli]